VLNRGSTVGPQTNVRSSPERRGRPSRLGRQRWLRDATTRGGALGWAGGEGQERQPLERNGGGCDSMEQREEAAPTVGIGAEAGVIFRCSKSGKGECYLGLARVSGRGRRAFKGGQGEKRRQTANKRNGSTGCDTRHATYFAGLDRKRTRSSGRMAEEV
jgi:hypothetical protein